MPGLSKKSSQAAFDGAITSRLPSRTMLTLAVFANPTRPKERPPEGGLGKA